MFLQIAITVILIIYILNPSKLSSIFARFFGTTLPKMSKAQIERVEKLIASKPVFVASKSYCPYCAASKRTLAELDADAYVLELDTLEDGDEIQSALLSITGQRTVPNIFIGGKHIGGNSDLQALKSKGELKKAISAAKI